MRALGAARPLGIEGPVHRWHLRDHWSAELVALDHDIIRVRFKHDRRYRLDRTWTVAPDGDVPWEGRPRDALDGFPLPPMARAETGRSVFLDTETVRLVVHHDPFRIVWADRRTARVFARDRATQPYGADDARGDIAHHMARLPGDRHFGLGEKSGDLDKTGRRLRTLNLDALGYDAETSDPLYKSWPVLICRTDGAGAYALLYDTLATSAFDLGCAFSNYHEPYRSFEAEDGDLDYYLVYGPEIRAVQTRLTRLLGGVAFPPRASLGYIGSTMAYTDAPDAQAQLTGFLDRAAAERMPATVFQMSSGYTLIGDKRCVFTWNRDRVPDPEGLAQAYADHGVVPAPNIKPCLLTEHPEHHALAAAGAFVGTADGEPVVEQFWGGTGAHLDFTNPYAIRWWQEQLTVSLLSKGFPATWNDNNEYEIWDRGAMADGFGRPFPLHLARPLMAVLMTRASVEAQRAHAPGKRPFAISRSGGPGIQRYAQVWTGDNATSWKTLRYNQRMGLGMALCGMVNMGHDVGGLVGPEPEPELLVRWVQNGIVHPRFCIHSWNDCADDAPITEPWMYPAVAEEIRAAFGLRYRLLPYLYTLLWQAHRTGEAILRPTFYDFDADPRTFDPCDEAMLGPSLLIAPVMEPGARRRTVYLPRGPAAWCCFHTGERYAAGRTVAVPAPLDRLPLFVPEGAMLPLSPYAGPRAAGADDRRQLALFPPASSGRSAAVLFDDDGESVLDGPGRHRLTRVYLDANADRLAISLSTEGGYRTAYRALEVVLPPGETRPVAGAERWAEGWRIPVD